MSDKEKENIFIRSERGKRGTKKRRIKWNKIFRRSESPFSRVTKECEEERSQSVTCSRK